MKTAVVILNFNGKHHLATFLPSVLKYSKDAELWVADNGSFDESISYLLKYFPEIRIFQLETNSGFAGGYNAALKAIAADNYILLNSDVAVTENWIPPLINLLEGNDKVSACQPKILSYTNKEFFEYAGAAGGFLDKWGYPFCRGRIFNTLEKDENQYDNSSEIFWASGACLAIKSDIFHALGGFDERFLHIWKKLIFVGEFRIQVIQLPLYPIVLYII